MAPMRPQSVRRPLASALLAVVAVGLSVLVAIQGLTFVSYRHHSQAQRVALADGTARPTPELRSRQTVHARGGAYTETDSDSDYEDEDDEEYEFIPGFIGYQYLKPGQEFEGVVQNLVDFGAFVDYGADRAGLVPLSKMSEQRVETPQDVLKEGQNVKVYVAEVNVAEEKVTLSLVQSKAFPRGSRPPLGQRGGGGVAADIDVTPLKDVPSSQWLTGTVVRTQVFGAFVDIKPPGSDDEITGLVHITQLADKFVQNVEEEVSVGQEVKVRIINVDTNTKRVSLTMLSESGAAQRSNMVGGGGGRGRGSADLSAFEGVTDWLDGTVSRIENYGAFVEVPPPSGGEPVTGLVHISQLQDGFVDDPAEVVEEGMSVKVRVIEAKGGKLSLSMREDGGDDSGESSEVF